MTTSSAQQQGAAVRPPDGEPGAEGPVGERGRGVRRRRGWKATLAELPGLIALALVLAFLIKTFLVQAFFIPSGSMIPTLEIGDRVLVEKITGRFRGPERGEIWVFRRPGVPEEGFSLAQVGRSFLEGVGVMRPNAEIDLIKRVIGLPGDTVELRDGVVFVNGIMLEEPYAGPETRDYPPTVVPAGQYFVMGDNRANSLDSRFTLGFVPRENLVGRAFVVLFPFGNATFALDEDYPAVGEGREPVPAATPVPAAGG